MLYLTAQQSAQYGEAIFPRMVARTPDQPRVYEAYLGHLRRIGDQRRFDRVMAQAQERFGQGPTAVPPAPATEP